MSLKSVVKSMITPGLPELKAVAAQEAMAFTRDAGATRDTHSNMRCVVLKGILGLLVDQMGIGVFGMMDFRWHHNKQIRRQSLIL
jgi:hypothetical protein